MDRITLQLRNDLAELQRLWAAVDQFAQAHGWGGSSLGDMHLALEEAATNVITYALPSASTGDQGEPTFTVSLDWQDGEVVAEIADPGQPFNPLTLPPPDFETPLEDMKVGGLGIHLVRQLMDQVDYRRHDGQNILTLRKRMVCTDL